MSVDVAYEEDEIEEHRPLLSKSMVLHRGLLKTINSYVLRLSSQICKLCEKLLAVASQIDPALAVVGPYAQWQQGQCKCRPMCMCSDSSGSTNLGLCVRSGSNGPTS